jgi:hypothetical protein
MDLPTDWLVLSEAVRNRMNEPLLRLRERKAPPQAAEHESPTESDSALPALWNRLPTAPLLPVTQGLSGIGLSRIGQ